MKRTIPKTRKLRKVKTTFSTCPVRNDLHPAVVADALHKVAHQFRVEERHRSFSSFKEEVADE